MRYSVLFFAILSIPTFVYSATIVVPDDYATIQGAIDAAVIGDTVLVKPGTYMENIDFKGKAITVRGDQGAAKTIIDGNQAGSVVTCQSGEGPDSVLDEFTITNGTGTIHGGNYRGGGMFILNSNPIVLNCIFVKNSVNGNQAYGGGMFSFNCCPKVINCIFSENTAKDGGGMTGSAEVTSCVFIGNKATYLGGGIDGCSATITNCLVIENTAAYGGGIGTWDGNPIIINCTLIGNSATVSGGGIYNWNSYPTVTNCILWNDAPQEINNENGSASTVTYSCVQGGYPGTGNIYSDPLIVDKTNGDYHLTYPSPCRNTGNNSPVTEITDFEGDPRIAYGTVDMGADEFYNHFYVTGDMTPGGSIQGKFVGLPGTNPVGLFIGSGILPTPANTMWGEYWLQAPWFLFTLIPIPSNGIIVLPTTLPGSIPAPYDIPMQALIGLNAESLSNLCVLEVR